MHRSLLLAAALACAACQPKSQRPPGDELPYPALDMAAMDRSTSPCQDFYQYACGRWIAETPVPPDRTSWVRVAGELEERNLRLLRRFLDDAVDGKVDAHDRYGRKAGDFYAACLDEVDVEARGRAELQAEWARLDAVGDRARLAEELSRLSAMGVAAPFSFRAVVDPTDPRRALLALEAGGLGLPRRELYLSDGADAAGVRVRYARHVQAELVLAGLSAAQAQAAAEGAVEVERALAEARTAGPAEAPGPQDLRRLEALAPGFPWARLLSAVGAGARTQLSLAEPGFAAGVGRLFAEAPLERWKGYLRWRLAEAMADERALPAAMAEERHRFQAAIGPAPATLRPRWKHCVELTGRTFGLALGFGRRQLGLAGRERAARVVSAVEQGMVAAVESAPWADRPTQALAGDKVEAMETLVGFPDAGPDYDKLRVGRTSYFRNVLSARRFAVVQEVARAARPVDRAEWLLPSFASAPAYWPERNALCVPAGALLPPAWAADAPEPVVYGSVGTQVGRTLAGALEDAGRRRGPRGEAGDWWTPEAARRFEAGAACLAEQYEAFQAEAGTSDDGARALPVNLSDLAGLRAAWEALRAARDAGEPDRFLGFTADQQFFLAYAQTLCTAGRGVAEPRAGGVPARFRVNGPLANLPDFAKAFRCEAGSWMARPAAARCQLW